MPESLKCRWCPFVATPCDDARCDAGRVLSAHVNDQHNQRDLIMAGVEHAYDGGNRAADEALAELEPGHQSVYYWDEY